MIAIWRTRHPPLSAGRANLVGMVTPALVNRYTVVPRLRVRGDAAIADLKRLTIAGLGLAAGGCSGSSRCLVSLTRCELAWQRDLGS